MNRAQLMSVLLTLLAACTKVPSKERSSSPPSPEPSVTVQPDPEPYEGGMPFDQDAAGTPPFDAGCPDALPEAGADCDEWVGARDCAYGDVLCKCNSIPEGTWWSCAP